MLTRRTSSAPRIPAVLVIPSSLVLSGSPMFFKEVKDEIDDDYCASYLQ
jgi:hypothetical protein